ncbi:MAG: hypothetical protein AAGH76_07770 [Pseudomonadota bacterium]
MNDFLTAIFRLAIFRGTPAAMPSAPLWLAIVCAVSFVVMLIVLSTPLGANDSLPVYLSYNVIIYGTVALLLLANRRQQRLVQTMIAMLAVDNVLTLAQALAVVVASRYSLVAAMPVWPVTFWLLFAQSRILGSALDWHPAIALIFLFVIALLGASLVSAIGGPIDGATEAVAATSLLGFG